MLFNFLEGAQLTGVKRFVLLSSIAAFSGMAPPFNEDTRFPVQVMVDDHPEALLVTTEPDGTRQINLPPYETTVKRALEFITLDYAYPMQFGFVGRREASQSAI